MGSVGRRAREALSRRRRPSARAAESHVREPTLTPHEQTVVEQVRPFTMTSAERIVATIDAVDHVVREGIAGALVECGVWRGGMVLAMIRTLQRHGIGDRDIFLYDTFAGMTEPTEHDTSRFDRPAVETWS